MALKIKEALILAGGLGTRLRTVMPETPKPMAQINGKPFLEYQIDYLRSQGIKRIVLCVYYLKEQIMDYFGDGKKSGVNIVYAIEDEPLGTGGAIKNAIDQACLSDFFLVLNGDTFFEWKIKDLRQEPFLSKAEMVILVAPTIEHSSSVVRLDSDNRVTDYNEKPQINIENRVFCGAGVYIIKKDLIREWPARKFSLEYDFIPQSVSKGSVYAQITDSKIYDIGTPERIRVFSDLLDRSGNPSGCRLCGLPEIKYYATDFKNNKYWECAECGFIFQYPLAQETDDSRMWTHAVDPDNKERDLTQERDFKLKNWYGGIADNIKTLAPGNVLDIGCGLGYLLSALPSTWRKYGFDTSEFARSFIKNNFKDINLIEGLDLDETAPSAEHKNAYDLVICYHVIEHVQRPAVFLKNLTMLLKPEGILIIGTPNMGSIAAKIFKGSFRLLGGGHRGLFNEKNLGELLAKNNLRIYKKEFPFFKTDYFTLANLMKMLNPGRVSPPFYGSIMTFYAINASQPDPRE